MIELYRVSPLLLIFSDADIVLSLLNSQTLTRLLNAVGAGIHHVTVTKRNKPSVLIDVPLIFSESVELAIDPLRNDAMLFFKMLREDMVSVVTKVAILLKAPVDSIEVEVLRCNKTMLR